MLQELEACLRRDLQIVTYQGIMRVELAVRRNLLEDDFVSLHEVETRQCDRDGLATRTDWESFNNAYSRYSTSANSNLVYRSHRHAKRSGKSD